MQSSFEFDNNIRENPSRTLQDIGDSSLKFIFNSRTNYRNGGTRLLFSYQGGLQTYLNNRIENKLINEVEAGASSLFRRISIGARASGRLKQYLNDIIDYSYGTAEVTLGFPFFLKTRSDLSLSTSELNYQHQRFTGFDYSEKRLRWGWSRKLARRLTGRLEISGAEINYDRLFAESKQRDRNVTTQIKFNYTRTFLVDLSYQFQQNDSNTPGYEFSKHQFILIFGTPLGHALWLRVYGAFQSKRYKDARIPDFTIDVEAERDESNFLIADISKDINPSIAVLLRLAYYNNESILRSRFYRKTLVTCGFDFRF